MRWWGWGVDGHDAPLPAPALALLRDELGVDPATDLRPVALDDVELADPALLPPTRALLERAVGAEHVRDDRLARVTHSAGRSYPDLVRLRSGRGLNAPDAVVLPGTREEVARVLEICAREGVAVVPFGGGTSVVGGVEALRGPLQRRGDRRPRAARGPPGRRRELAACDLRRRDARARRREHARHPRADARTPAAELRVLDRRRLGGDPLGGAGLDRLRPHRRARRRAARADAERRARHPHHPRERRRAEPARAAAGIRGRPRDHHRRHAARPPATARAALRRLRAARLPRRPAGTARARAGRRRARPRAPVGRRRDAPVAPARLPPDSVRPAARLPRCPPPRRRLPRHRRLRRRAGPGRAPARARSRRHAPPRRRRARQRARGRMGEGPLPRRLHPRRAPAPRRPRRHARDRDDVDEPPLRPPRGSRGAARCADEPRHAAARRLPRLAPLRHRRVAVLHVPRAPGAGSRDRAVARGESRRHRRDLRRRRHPHPPPRGGHRPRPVAARARSARSASTPSAR